MNYEQHFDFFLKNRGRDLNDPGSAEVRNWYRHFSNKKIFRYRLRHWYSNKYFV